MSNAGKMLDVGGFYTDELMLKHPCLLFEVKLEHLSPQIAFTIMSFLLAQRQSSSG